ncbi:MAG: hypothetical protein JWQ73_1025 [Variovorax sp.]|jgi:hypothetical protein|nr:hypothetical protein [Variovorax sp.]
MIHPIFMTVLRRPELLANHLANYAELVKGELAALGTALAVRAAGAVVALVAVLLALGLTGIAVMLGFLHGAFHWVLIIVPGVAWVLAGVGAALAMRSTVKGEVEGLKDEVQADFNMLRLIKEARHD